jgi:tetratricopeptide (TPR) repeat protein
MSTHKCRRLGWHWMAVVLMLGAGHVAMAQDTAGTNLASAGANDPAVTEASVISNQSTLRSTLEIQDQLHNLQLTGEKERQQAQADAAALNLRLTSIENSLASQQVDGFKDILRSSDIALITALVFACFGFLVLLLAAYLQWQMVNRIKAMAAALPGYAKMSGGPDQGALGAGESTATLLTGNVERPTAQFLGAIERLEKRIQEMESGAHTHHALPEGASTNGTTAVVSGNGSETAGSDKERTISVLLNKGQTQLKLDQAESALASFDEALGLEPNRTDALLGRGAALERLQRLNEAIECYDRAIAADGSMTMAYLHKGGVFNRMERYSEALECYEQALRSQEKAQTAEAAAG